MAPHRSPGESGRSVPAVVQILSWAVLTAILYAGFHLQVTSPQHRTRVGTDFRIYWRSGLLLRQGQDAYQPILGHLGFVYPPFALLPFRALTHMSMDAAFRTWLAVQAGVIAMLLVVAVRRGMRAWLLVPAVMAIVVNGYMYRCTTMGQIGVMLLGLVAFDFMQRDDRRLRGLLTGVAVGVKFTPAIFLVHWLFRRNWRAAVMGVVGFLCTVAIGFVAAPATSRGYWHEALVQHRLGTGVPSQYGNANNQSVTNAVQILFGPSASHASAGLVLAVLMTLVGLVAASLADRMQRPWLTIALLGTASCLATGSTWDHHYVWIIAAVLALLGGELRRMWASTLVVIAWILWSIPRLWHALATHRRETFTHLQYLEAIATPAFACLFVAASLVELFLARRRRIGTTVPGKATIARGVAIPAEPPTAATP